MQQSPASPSKLLASNGKSSTTTITTTTYDDPMTLTIACTHDLTSRGDGLASHPRTYFPGVETKKGATIPGQAPGGARVTACPAGQGSLGEWAPTRWGCLPGTHPERFATMAVWHCMLMVLHRYWGGLRRPHSPDFAPKVQLDKSGVPLVRSHLSPVLCDGKAGGALPDFKSGLL